MQLIKGGYFHAVGIEISRREIWQKGFTDHRIRDAQDFAGHRIYIHQNPVGGKILGNPAEYRYCSAYPGFKLMCGPQRLKPSSVSEPEWHDSKSCPSRSCWLQVGSILTRPKRKKCCKRRPRAGGSTLMSLANLPMFSIIVEFKEKKDGQE